MERPHRLASVLYGLSTDAGMGMPCVRAYSISSGRVMPHSRAGATTRMSGFSARADTSIRTWSLPLPVQPWAMMPAFSNSAISTSFCVMSGRPSAVASGYLPS